MINPRQKVVLAIEMHDHLDVKVDPQLSAREPLGRIAERGEVRVENDNMQARSLSPVQTDDMLARGVGSKCEFSLAAVNLRMVKLPQNLKTSYSCKIPWKG